MITLRGRLKRTLAERNHHEPKVARSALATSANLHAVVSTAGLHASADIPEGSGSGGAASSTAKSTAATTATAATAAGSTVADIPHNGSEREALEVAEGHGLIEEWTWEGVWAFGDLPYEEEEKNQESAAAGQKEEENKGASPDSAAPLAGLEKNGNDLKDTNAASGEHTSVPCADSEKPAKDAALASEKASTKPQKPIRKGPGRPPKKKNAAAAAAAATKPRPFSYRWLKAVDAGEVVVPSSLIVMSAEAEEEELRGGTTTGFGSDSGGEGGTMAEGCSLSAEDEGKNAVAAVKTESLNGGHAKESVADKLPKKKSSSDARSETSVSPLRDAVLADAISTKKENQMLGVAKHSDGDVIMGNHGGEANQALASGSKKTDASFDSASTAADAKNEASNRPAAASATATNSLTETPKTRRDGPLRDPRLPRTYGDPPYTDASSSVPPGRCPPGGKWEGHFENVVPNSRAGRKKKGQPDKKPDNRVREMFYLFFNADPPLAARDVFEEGDSTLAANNMLDDRTSTTNIGGAHGDTEEEGHNFLLKGSIHVRGYGTNRFGTFEIVGSLDVKTGLLKCQRMYVPVPTAAEISRATGQKRSTTGRSLRGLDLTIPGDDEESGRRGASGRKRKSTWKKRHMDEEKVAGADGKPIPAGDLPGVGGVDIASVVKKRSRLSNESLGGRGSAAMPGGGGGSGSVLKPGAGNLKPPSLPPPQCRGAQDAQSLKINAPPTSLILAAGAKNTPPSRAFVGSGKKGKKKKNKEQQKGVNPPTVLSHPLAQKGPITTREVAIPSPPPAAAPTLPAAGDPFLARWRAAHYLYYQRVEKEPESEGPTWGATAAMSQASGIGSITAGGSSNTLLKINFVVYEGEMHDGVRDGRGICLYNNDTLYEGQWRRNKEHGAGTLMTADRTRIIYSGAWEKGKMHGHGSYHYYIESPSGRVLENGKYVGSFRQNLRNGHGIYTLPDGCVYDGEFRDNVPNGYGIFRWRDGSVYEGPWREGKRHGATGIMMSSDGFRYEGSWVNNAMEGRGVATYPKGQVYDGTWVQGKREGRGTIRFTNGAIYEGRFKDDYMEGQGTMKMNRNVIIPKLTKEEDGNEISKVHLSTDCGSEGKKHDWMIPLQFQSDIGHIHQKAGFTQIGL